MPIARAALTPLLVVACLATSAPAWAFVEGDLHTAAIAGDVRAVERLLGDGARTETRDDHGRTPLLAAAQLGHKAVALALLAQGANIEAVDENGYTPLIWASQQGHTAVVAALLARGASVHAREKHDYTALEWAVWEGHINPVRLLLAYDAEPMRQTKFGFSAMDLAKRRGNKVMVALLAPKPIPPVAVAVAAKPTSPPAAKPVPVAAAPSPAPKKPASTPVPRPRPLIPAVVAPAVTMTEGNRTPTRIAPNPLVAVVPVAPKRTSPPVVQPQPSIAPAPVAAVSAGSPTPVSIAMAEPTVSSPAIVTPPRTHATTGIGYSKQGRPLHLASLGHGPRTVLFVGSIHGDEAQGTDVIYRLLREIPRIPTLLQRTRLLAIPNANPDGVARKMRTNLAGVDLNRNFPTRWRLTPRGRTFGGPSPLSEPESQALQRVIDRERPDLIVSFHAHMACNNFDGTAAEPIAKAMARLNGYRLLPQIGYETPGSLGQHAAFGMGIPIVTLEVGFEAPDVLWRRVRDSLLVALEPSRF